VTRRRTDANHAAIRDGLRGIPGVSVQDTSQYPGMLDLLVGRAGHTYRLEVKVPGKVPRFTKAETELLLSWTGHAAVVTTLEEALREIGLEGGDV